MSTWNYRITREAITNPDGTTDAMYACREVHYDDDGKVTAWSATPTPGTKPLAPCWSRD